MQNVPKIVRERLRAATPAVNHPDADALTAFAEHSLPGVERAVVLRHLACCGDCRDIVALALPEAEPAQNAMNPSPSGRLTWPMLRWGFVTAGVVIIASIGILRYRSRSQAGTMSASNQAPTAQATAAEAKDQPLATPAPPPPAEEREKIQSPAAPASGGSLMMDHAPARDKKGATSVAPPSPVLAQQFHGSAYESAIRRGVAGGAVGGPILPNQWQQQNIAQNQAVAPVPSSVAGQQEASGTFTVRGQAAAANKTVATKPADASGADAFATLAQNTNTTVLQYNGAAQPSADKPTVERAKPLALPAGQIGGYVVDPNGAGVSSARVTLVPSTMGGATTTITNSEGVWLVAGLPTGNYKVAAEAPGFTTAVKDLHYDANQPKMYSLSLSPGSVSETVEVSAQAVQVQAETANIGGATTKGANNQIPLNGRNVMQIVSLAPGGLQTFWKLNSGGRLERSADQGQTWQAVDVTSTPALYVANLAVTAEISKAKAKDAEKARKVSVPLSFRALAVAGSDVWVGGSGGALYRSADAGNHWTRIVPFASGAALTDDVISLEFADPQHGKLSTSTAEVWTTADAGQTWQKQ